MRTVCLMLILASGGFGQIEGRRIAPLSGRRVALIVGNKSYSSKPLTNPENDARAVAGALVEIGFAPADVRVVVDARQTEMRRVFREFAESVRAGDLAFVYYAGHGVEVRGRNYLLPIDFPADATEGWVQDEAVSVQGVLQALDQQGARVRVLILDACRDNPLRAVRSTAGGLAPMEGRGSLIVFSTESGRVAADSGVFARHLVEGLRAPGISLDDAVRRVSRNVARATGEAQVPAIYGLLLEDVFLARGRPPAAVSADLPKPPAPANGAIPSIALPTDPDRSSTRLERTNWITGDLNSREQISFGLNGSCEYALSKNTTVARYTCRWSAQADGRVLVVVESGLRSVFRMTTFHTLEQEAACYSANGEPCALLPPRVKKSWTKIDWQR